jgi:hypothetical protein
VVAVTSVVAVLRLLFVSGGAGGVARMLGAG